MHLHKSTLTTCFIATLAACGSDTTGDPTPTTIPQCDASEYVAFDSGNHQNQDIRLGVYGDMVALMNEGRADTSLAAAKFSEAKALYFDLGSSANFRDKVQGRKDDHLTDSPIQGDRLDATIVQWLDAGATAAAHAQPSLAANVAKQWVDKTFTEFFFLSVHHESLAGTRKNWDEAYGYYGSGSTNDEGALRGLAKTASKRDSNNGTNVEAAIFNDLIDGACSLGVALDEQSLDSLDPDTHSTLAATIERVDTNMQEVLAASVGHEAIGMQGIIADGISGDDTDDLWVKLAELEPFFLPLERLMQAAGGESATRATQIRSWIDLADFADLSDTAWTATFAVQDAGQTVPERIVTLLEAEFGIEIQG